MLVGSAEIHSESSAGAPGGGSELNDLFTKLRARQLEFEMFSYLATIGISENGQFYVSNYRNRALRGSLDALLPQPDGDMRLWQIRSARQGKKKLVLALV